MTPSISNHYSSWPHYSEDEVEAVCRVLQSNKVNYWTGIETRAFEREFAAWVGTQHAVALANGTLALEAALKAIGVGVGDEVIVTPRTFLASVSAIIQCGATPVFADVDRDTQNITANTIAEVLSSSTRAILCVHLAGMPCDMDPIMELARGHHLYVIEDCAQAHGARYKGRMVGSIGDLGAWSFCQDKIMTTGGEGGMVTTNDERWWSYIWSYKDHGKSWDAVYHREHTDGFKWVHESFGTNWRMLEMQAVIGRIQLRKMENWTKDRTRNAQRLATLLKRYPQFRIPPVPEGIEHAYYKFYTFVDGKQLAPGWTRNRLIDEMVHQGIPCYHGSCPEVYLEKAFNGTTYRPKHRLPVAQELGETSLMFVVHPSLTMAEVDAMCTAIAGVLDRACLNLNLKSTSTLDCS